MLRVQCLGFILIVLVCGSYAQCPSCPPSPCFEYTLSKCIEELWKIPKRTTPNIDKFKSAVMSLLCNANDRTIGYLTSISMWSAAYFTNMPTAVHPSCSFGKLLNQTIVTDLTDDCCAKEGLKKAVDQYQDLCFSRLDHTVTMSMKLAGCPIKVPCVKPPAPCPKGAAPEMFLVDKTKEIPEKLKPILLKMVQSCNPDDQALAEAVFASSTKSSIDFFERALSDEAFIKIAQLNACSVKVAQKCCKDHEKQLRSWAELRKKKVLEQGF